MASTAIPQTDAALLAAQAKAGQAGVEAYEAAKRELGNSRQTAAANAMAAAENRGAPEGAIEAAMSNTMGMYDRRDAALSNAAAANAMSLSQRDARMADYNRGVLEARDLIGAQADLVAAPIDAQSRYSVADIEARGRQSVDQIEAQRRLTLLEMEAAYREAQRAAAERAAAARRAAASDKSSSLSANKTELTALLGNRVTPVMQAAMDQATEALRRVTKANSSTQQTASVQSFRASERADQALRDARKANPTNQTLKAGWDAVPSFGGKVNTVRPSTSSAIQSGWNALPGFNNREREAAAAAESRAKAALETALRNARAMEAERKAEAERGQARRTLALGQLATDPNNPSNVLLQQMLGSGQTFQSGRDVYRVLGGFDDYALAGSGKVTSRNSAGVPNVANAQRMMDNGSLRPMGDDRDTSTSALQTALTMAGIGLQGEGYDIDEAGLVNSMSDFQGQSFADFKGIEAGIGDVQAQRDRALAESQAMDDEDRQFRDDIDAANKPTAADEAALMDTYGVTFNDIKMSPDKAADIFELPEWPDLYNSGLEYLAQIRGGTAAEREADLVAEFPPNDPEQGEVNKLLIRILMNQL